jgi:hypothetical protein
MSSFRAWPGLGCKCIPAESRGLASRAVPRGRDHYRARGRAAERKLRRSASGRRAAGGLRCREALLVGSAWSERADLIFPGVDGFEHAEKYRGEPRRITVSVTPISSREYNPFVKATADGLSGAHSGCKAP